MCGRYKPAVGAVWIAASDTLFDFFCSKTQVEMQRFLSGQLLRWETVMDSYTLKRSLNLKYHHHHHHRHPPNLYIWICLHFLFWCWWTAECFNWSDCHVKGILLCTVPSLSFFCPGNNNKNELTLEFTILRGKKWRIKICSTGISQLRLEEINFPQYQLWACIGRILIRRILLSADVRLAAQGVARSPVISEGFEIDVAD